MLALQISSLRVVVNVLGTVVLAVYLALALLSYVQAPALWRSHLSAPQAMAFFSDLAERFPLVALHPSFESAAAVIISYCVPVAFATVAVLLLMMLLHRRERLLDSTIVALLMRWSVAFAVASVFAFPVFTQDFWLSMAWGRMVAEGTNPYHSLFTKEFTAGLPLDHFPMVMSYGPAWAIVSGAIMAVSGKSVLVATILFKAILVAAWIGSLVLIERITRLRPMLDRCLAMAAFGWMPLGVLQTVAEGHNDIAMVWPALLWLALLAQRRSTAPVALVGSALAKYVTAPLFAIDTIVAWRMHGLSWRQLILRLLAPGLLGLALFAAFFRSLDFFKGTQVISEWEFLQPRHAVEAIELAFGISLFPAEHVITAGFAVLAAYRLVVLLKSPTPDNTVKAALAVMSAVLFVAIAHVWPWYLVWAVAFAVLSPTWWLSRFVIGASITAPFALSFWWIEPVTDSREWASLALYVVAVLWCILTRAPVSAPAPDQSPEQVTGGSFGRP